MNKYLSEQSFADDFATPSVNFAADDHPDPWFNYRNSPAFHGFSAAYISLQTDINHTALQKLVESQSSNMKFQLVEFAQNTNEDLNQQLEKWMQQQVEQTPSSSAVNTVEVTLIKLSNNHYYCFYRYLVSHLTEAIEATITQVLSDYFHHHHSSDLTIDSFKAIAIISRKEQALIQQWAQPADNPIQANDLASATTNSTVVDYFQAQVTKNPHLIAITDETGHTTSYLALNQQANQLAHYLLEAGHGEGSIIAVCFDRSFKMIVAILAIFKIGAAYLPIAPDIPLQRKHFMLDNAKVTLLLSHSNFAFDVDKVTCLYLDQSESLQHYLDSDPQLHIAPNQLAYIIYTSGSTGVPKAVMIEHHSLSNLIQWHCHRYHITQNDNATLVAAISFDVSLWELWPYLSCGACVYPINDKSLLHSSAQLSEFFDRNAITCAYLPTSIAEHFIYDRQEQYPQTLRCLLTAGEMLQQFLPQDCPFEFYNNYGPTETTVISTMAQVGTASQQPSFSSPAIGQAIDNTVVYVVDERNRPVSIGAVGELCIGGAGLARGYLAQAELTAAKFIHCDIFGQTIRLYKTGDLARWLPHHDGALLQCLGRNDQQVQLRGFRIELGEIEVNLAQHPQVQKAVVLLDGEQTNGRLTAFVVLTESNIEQNQDISQTLTQYLTTRLPNYMLPETITVLDAFPLNANGKIDRNQLTTITTATPTTAFAAPTSDNEITLCQIMATLVGSQSIGIDDHFFHIGGNSLLATLFISRVRSQFNVELPWQVLFDQPTVRQLSLWLTQQTSNITETSITIDKDQPMVLSFAQQRLWFLENLEGQGNTYNLLYGYRLQGELNIAYLSQALRQLVIEHDSLRSYFPSLNGEATIEHLAAFDPLSIIDLTDYPDQKITLQIQQHIDKQLNHHFDLAQGPLLQIELLQIANQSSSKSDAKQPQYLLFINIHHIITDGWSLTLMIKQWGQYYQQLVENGQLAQPVSRPSYANHARWQRKWLDADKTEKQMHYWRQQLADAPPLLKLATDKPRPTTMRFRGKNYHHSLSAPIKTAISAVAQRYGCTEFMLILAVYQLLMSRYSGQNDIIIGSPIANRNHSHTEQLLGFVVNTLALRGHIDGNDSFEQLLQQSKQTTLGSYAHQDLPFDYIVEQLNPERSLSYTPVFQVMLVLQNMPAQSLQLTGVETTPMMIDQGKARFDITLSITANQDEFDCCWEYNTDLFLPSTIERMHQHFSLLLQQLLAQPNMLLADCQMLTPVEQNQLQQWNQTNKNRPTDQTIISLIEAQAQHNPHAPAVVFGETAQVQTSLNYQQLNQKANQLAHYLTTLGVDNHSLVAICHDRSVDMIIAWLATMKAGAGFVSLDSSYPPERILYMLEDSSAQVLLYQSHLVDVLPPQVLNNTTINAVCLDQQWPQLAQFEQTNLPIQPSGNDLAYQIYTSGSTGKPKGVMITHASYLNLALFQQDYFAIDHQARILQFASPSFDAACWELAMALPHGAQFHLSSAKQLMPSDSLVELLIHRQITHVTLPPSALAVLPQHPLPQLQHLVVAGEACPQSLVNQWQQNRQFYNAYGPTESTVCATIAHCDGQDITTPIGQPIDNTQIYIFTVNPDGSLGALQAPGLAGELCIVGDGLARGYHNRQQLTAEKFIEVDIFGQKQSVYRTGDLARWHRVSSKQQAHIEYLGRIDHQIKLRGFRIELSEIETNLGQHPQIQASVTIVFNHQGHARLVAYVTQQSAENHQDSLTQHTVNAQLRHYLKQRLPDYMIPAHFVLLDHMPLTANGKIDRSQLPQPQLVNDQQNYQAPRNDIETRLVKAFQSVLKIDRMGIFDNFFELGVDSILSIQVVSRARTMGLNFNPKDIFEYQNISELGQNVEHHQQVITSVTPTSGDMSLLPIQRRYFNLHGDHPHHFNQSVLLTLAQDCQPDLLQQAIDVIVAHHDVFQLKFDKKNDQWNGSFYPNQTALKERAKITLQFEDLSQWSEPNQSTKLQQRLNHYQASLDIHHGPIQQCVLFKLDHQQPLRLFWCIHHLVIDSVSWRILLDDLQTLYQQASEQQNLQLPAKTTSYQAWGEHLNTWSQSEALQQQINYWRALTPSAPLPVDIPNAANRQADVQHHLSIIDQKMTRALLHQAPAAFKTRVNDLLLTALLLTLRHWTGDHRHLIDVESHGRQHLTPAIDLSRSVGWFTALYTLSLELPSSTDLSKALKAIKQQLRQVPDDGLGYGVMRYLNEQDLPQAQILFNYLGQFDQTLDSDYFSFAEEAVGEEQGLQGSRHHLIEINAQVKNQQLAITWSYSGAQYHHASIEQLAQDYQRHLQALIEHCQHHFGYTPSDFPLANIQQNQLDSLAAQYQHEIEDIYPLTPMQQGMLFHSHFQPEHGAYIEQFHFKLNGPLQADLWQQAWQQLVNSHGPLRTAFARILAQPLQIVVKQALLPWQNLDWSDKSSEQQQQDLPQLLVAQRKLGFDQTQAPLMRLQLIKLQSNQHLVVWHFHHLLLDGWCLPLLLQAVFAHYDALCQGSAQPQPTSNQYRQYIQWLTTKQQQLSSAQQHWQQLLKGFTAPNQIATQPQQRSQPLVRQHSLDFDTKLSEQMTQFCRSHRLTLNNLFQGAWSALLSIYSGDRDIVFGVTTSGRNAPINGIETMLGTFINTLPARVTIDDASVIESLKTLQRQQQHNDQFGYCNLADIQKWSEVERPLALFDTLIVFENYPLGEQITGSGYNGPLTLCDFDGVEYTNYPLTLTVLPGHNISLNLSYDNHSFAPSFIARMANRLQQLLLTLLQTPTVTWPQLMAPSEQELALIQGWNQTQQHFEQYLSEQHTGEQTLAQLFDQQADCTPNNIALICDPTANGDTKALSYQQLQQQSNQLAHWLIAQGVQAGTLVGICFERNQQLVIAILAVLKAGGAYVPLDPDYPQKRLEYMLDDAKPTIVLGQQPLLDQLGQLTNSLCLIEQWSIVASNSTDNPPPRASANDPAYIIYTSGSTGQPKGVVGLHAGMVNRLNWGWQQYPLAKDEICLHRSSVNFVDHIAELFTPLLQGRTQVLLSQQTLRDVAAIANAVKHHQVRRLVIVPSVLQALLNQPTLQQALMSLRYIFCSGETLTAALVAECKAKLPNTKLINIYGSSEVSADVLVYDTRDHQGEHVALGKPVANTQVHILDQQLNPVPIGVQGQIYISGAHLAQGYLNQPQLTAEKFLEIELFGQSQRVYQTGDIGCWREDGNIEFNGRSDLQVKLRGMRIELGEIEAVLLQHPAIQTALAVLTEINHQPTLAVYIKPKPADNTEQSVNVSATALRQWLKGRLVQHMIPTSINLVEQFPLTPNGKIDRRALPAAQLIDNQQHRAPQSDNEILLCDIWSQVLEQTIDNAQADFFACGGHSLLAGQLAARVRHHCQIDMPLRIIFENPQLHEQALWLDAEQNTNTQALVQIAKQGPNQDKIMSFAQQRLWFLAQLEQQNNSFHILDAWQLHGDLDITALSQALSQLTARHQSLRSCFPQVDGVPKLHIKPAFNPLKLVQQPFDDLQEHIQRQLDIPFDLAEGPLFEVQLLQVKPREHILLFKLHHIITDGWSNRVLMADLNRLYNSTLNGHDALAPLAIEYSDFCAWQHQWLQGEVLQQQQQYWGDKLKDAPSLLALPTDHPRPAKMRNRGAHLQGKYDQAFSSQINQLSQNLGVSDFMLLLACYNLLLARYSGQDDIIVGSPTANRTMQQTEDLVGLFVNTLVLRNKVDMTESFEQLVEQVKATTLQAYAHQDIPFESLIEQLNPPRSMSHSPWFQVMFVLQNIKPAQLAFDQLEAREISFERQTAKVDLTLTMYKDNDCYIYDWEYNTDLFKPQTIERLAGHFTQLLQHIMTQPSQTLAQQPMLDIPMLTPAERQQLTDFNATQHDYPRQSSVVDLLQAQVSKTPDKVALIFEQQQLSYREFDGKANALALCLSQHQVKRGHYVPVMMATGLHVPLAFYAIMKCGAAFVPVDPRWPQQRITEVLQQLASPVVLTCEQHQQNPALAPWQVLAVDSDKLDQLSENPAAGASPDDAIFILFTSGSTGKPKGAINKHLGIVNRFCYMSAVYGEREDDVILQTAHHYFDAVIWQFFWPLTYGAHTVMPSASLGFEPQKVLDLLIRHRVTISDFVPATLEYLVEAMVNDQDLPPLDHLRRLVIGGDAIRPKTIKQLQACLPHIGLTNAYGPAETSIGVVFYDVPHPAPTAIPIGKPIHNVQARIVDKHNNLQPVGIAGELYISGDCVGLGYLHDEVQTKQRFSQDPFTDRPQQMYKTGDLARYLPDGNIEYLGRIDNQVKLRGLRIELGGIETLLNRHPQVKESVVIKYQGIEAGGIEALAAYVVLTTTAKDSNQTIEALRTWLQNKLPDYMVPASFTLMTQFSLSANGKVDRKALPKPVFATSGTQQPPTNALQRQLCQLWSEVLAHDINTIDNDFFAIGGHSLLATRLVSRIRQQCQIDMPLRLVFEKTTIAAQAQWLAEQQQSDEALHIPPLPASQPKPLSFAQQRLWFLQRLEGQQSLYNLSGSYLFTGDLNVEAMRKAWCTLVAHHQSLRTSFPTKDGQATLMVNDNYDPLHYIDLSHIDLSHIDLNQQFEQQLEQHISQHTHITFDLANGPLLSIKLLKLPYPSQHLMIFNIHHIISDAWSMDVLYTSFCRLYNAYMGGQPFELAPLPIQYSDYAAWQRQRLNQQELERQLDYWRTKLDGLPQRLDLPCDFARPAQMQFNGRHHVSQLDSDMSEQIRQFSQQHNVTVFMTLICAYNLLLANYSGQNDIAIGSPVANRNHQDCEALVGFFVNTQVLRTTIDHGASLSSLLQQIKQNTLEALSYQEIPFEFLIEKLNPPRNQSHTPFFQVMFVLQSAPLQQVELQGLTLQQRPHDNLKSKYDITLSIVETPQGFECHWEYCTDLFLPQTIARMAKHYHNLLQQMLTDVNQSAAQCSMLDQQEYQQLLTCGRNSAPLPPQQTLVELMQTQLERTPDHIAVSYNNSHGISEQLSYRQLNQRANQLAHYLLALKNDQNQALIQPQDIIALCVDRSIDMVIGMLAIIKAGCAYLPLDPDHPPERLQYMLSDAKAPLLLGHGKLLSQLTQSTAKVVAIDNMQQLCGDLSEDNPALTVSPEDLAYIIYTSGSTGQPKAIAIPQVAVTRLVKNSDYIRLNQTDVMAQAANNSFDAATFEIWGSLLNGARLVIVPKQIVLSPRLFADFIRTEQISTLFLTTALFNQIAQIAPWGFAGLTTLLFGGEQVNTHWVETVLTKAPPQRLLHVYGPTESTTFATWHEVKLAALAGQNGELNNVPIGRPLANTDAYVLSPPDDHTQAGQLVATGLRGELCLGGLGLAKGYLNNPQLNAEKFIEVEINGKSERLYRSGDIVRWVVDPNDPQQYAIEYLNRIDHQIKLRGFRIELSEIDVLLGQHPDIQQVCVVQQQHNGQLAAYVSLSQPLADANSQLRDWLKPKLPDYMVPAVIMVLPQLPLTPNGKVDRKALPPAIDSSIDTANQSHNLAKTAMEKTIADIWSNCLQLETIGIEQNFFDVGGHSLLLVQVHSQLEQALSQSIDVMKLFEYTTIATLARYLQQNQLPQKSQNSKTKSTATARTPNKNASRQANAFKRQKQIKKNMVRKNG